MPDGRRNGDTWPWWRPSTPRYPDTAQFEAGDLLLFAFGGAAGTAAEPIRRAQSHLKFAAEHAVFTHAAVYLGGGCVLCEAVDPMVRLHIVPGMVMPVETATEDADVMMVRRVKGKPAEQRARIAGFAMSYLDDAYGWEDCRRVKDAIRRRVLLPESAGAGILCSMLFARSVVRAFPRSRLTFRPRPSGRDDGIVLPATLAESGLLETVGWCPVGGARD